MSLARRLIAVATLMFAGWATASWAADAASIPNLGGGAKLQKTEAARRAEDEKCTHCHDETETRPILAIYQTKHGVRGDARTPTCQDCHGPSEKHLGGNIDGTGRPRPDRIFGTHRTPAGYEPSSPQEQTEVCLSCHKAGLRMRWPGSQHQSNDVPCAACHTNHTPQDKVLVKTEQPAVCFACHKEQRAQIKQISTHPIDAGKISCSDCHNPHGSSGPKLLAKNTITETCFTCHADKRGPFLWEHQPVNEDCTNCHTPHGSNITPLLKSRPPFLCIECHNGPHQSSGSTAIGSNTALASGTTYGARGCMNCHTMVHGSNSPAGAFLHR